jgi:2,4'-dihydroxyacetophenone dioxygenase
MVVIDMNPTDIHRGEEELPWVDDGQGSLYKILVAKVREGLWIVRNRFEPGVQVQTHRHTGPVYAYTISGCWNYAESEFVNRAGSFLYEPAGSQHTLMVPEDNDEVTDVWFQIYGANLNLGADGKIETVTDAAFVLGAYRSACARIGRPDPVVIID